MDGDEARIWTPVEHKSAPEPDILKQRLTAGGQVCVVPAVVYPILLHHGTEDWPYPDTLAEAYGLPPELVALGPLTFRYGLAHLLDTPDDQLSGHRRKAEPKVRPKLYCGR